MAHSVKKPWSTSKLRRFKTPEELLTFVGGTAADIDDETYTKLSEEMQRSRKRGALRRSAS